jgi:hypothetical protein
VEHEHNWVFLGELIQHYSKRDLKQLAPEDLPGMSRLEYCGGCGSARLHLAGTQWAVIESEVTKKFLKKFTTATNVTVKNPPPELTFKPRSPTTKKRLGKGLADLLVETSTRTSVKGLLPPKEPEE